MLFVFNFDLASSFLDFILETSVKDQKKLDLILETLVKDQKTNNGGQKRSKKSNGGQKKNNGGQRRSKKNNGGQKNNNGGQRRTMKVQRVDAEYVKKRVNNTKLQAFGQL